MIHGQYGYKKEVINGQEKWVFVYCIDDNKFYEEIMDYGKLLVHGNKEKEKTNDTKSIL